MVVESADTPMIAQYWAELLECPILGSDGPGIAVQLDGDARLMFVPSRAAKAGKNSLHLDLGSSSAAHQAAVAERACRLGGSRIDIGQGPVPWVVLADPEGNEFCVLEPRDEYRHAGPIAAVVIDAVNPVDLCQFWSKALELPIVRTHPQYASLRRPSEFWLEFVHNTELKLDRNRMHLRLARDDEVPDERLDQPSDREAVTRAPHHTGTAHDSAVIGLLDLERNEFCLSPS